jgi:hypothetical protein
MTARRLALWSAVAWSAIASPIFAQSTPRPEFRVIRATRPPIIDGALDDEVWQSAPVAAGEWLSYNPLHGQAIPQKTTVWLTYDADYLYFAFKCDDPDPSQIKTSITRRDNIWQDDWVGLSLDALGTGQLSYHMMVNPSGVQLDLLNSVAGNEDSAPDWRWDSAGKLTETGYAVEVRLPLQSIRFKGGDDTKMGILFFRRVSRTGVSVSWPAMDPGVWVFERHATLRFDSIAPRLAREVLPSATYSRAETRDTPTRWNAADGEGDVGVSGKVGVTSTVTLDATINPDFSQVESDAFQVEVNRRFPIFFAEKRPFFMEGVGIFSLAGSNPGFPAGLRAAVHTRQIVDPIFGAKVTGSAGRFAFGTLSAVDEAAGRDVPDGNRGSGKDRIFTIARGQYSLGPSNYAGGLYTDTRFAGGFNRVAGTDLAWRVNETQRLDAFVLASRTRQVGESNVTSGVGTQVGYNYNTKRWAAFATLEHYDRNFAMATAFLNRVNFTELSTYAAISFYPDEQRFAWLPRVEVFSFVQGGEDRNAGGGELVAISGMRLHTTRQGFLGVEYAGGFEHWQGRRFDRGRPNAYGFIQLFRWLALNGNYSEGDAVYYDSPDPFQGFSRETGFGTTVQPSGRLSQSFDYRHIAFDRASTRERIYTIDIVNTKTTYQFTRALSVRGIVQYDSSRDRVLTDFLGSYEPTPGTVIYIGYGSLIERRDYVDGKWVNGEGIFRTTQRGLFLKASYLYRF